MGPLILAFGLATALQAGYISAQFTGFVSASLMNLVLRIQEISDLQMLQDNN